MIDIVKFRENALSKGICDEYLGLFDGCMSKRQLFDLGCRIEPAKYLIKSISEGWGVSPIYIKDNFHQFINGQYKATFKKGEKGEYTSQMWCCAMHEFVLANTTVCVFLSCNVDVYVKDFNVCHILTDDSSVIRLHVGGGSAAYVETYSDNVMVVEDESKGNVKIKRLK